MQDRKKYGKNHMEIITTENNWDHISEANIVEWTIEKNTRKKMAKTL